MLPEKWQIAVTPESKQALGKWRSSGPLGTTSKPGFCCSPTKDGTKGYWLPEADKDHEIISFEDFRRYVLKEQIEFNYEMY